MFIQGPDQVPLIEDLEQIFMRSWRESHLSEIRQYQQPQTPATQGRHYGIDVRLSFFPSVKRITQNKEKQEVKCFRQDQKTFYIKIFYVESIFHT